MRNILITGMHGFIGNSLALYLSEKFQNIKILEIDADTSYSIVLKYAKKATFIYHLEELMHSKDENNLNRINIQFTERLIHALIQCNSKAPIVYLSSIQALGRNKYGNSKFEAEQLLIHYYNEYHAPLCIYRLPHVFGKGEPVSSNSIISTYCYKIANGLEYIHKNPEDILKFVNITDVIEEFIRALEGFPNMTADSRFASIPQIHTITRSELIKKITAFANGRLTNYIPSLVGKFDNQLYSTFMSYVKIDDLCYALKKTECNSGWITQVLNLQGQGSIKVIHINANMFSKKHWHEERVQKIIVVQGNVIVHLEKRETGETLEYNVTGQSPIIIDVPPGCAHAIQNIGELEAVIILLSNQTTSNARPDTFYC